VTTLVEGPLPSDADLERAAAAGDRDAFDRLTTRHFDSVYDYLRRIMRNEHDAQDLTQETFVRAMTHLKVESAGRGNYRSYLFTIAHRLALNLLRDRKPVASPRSDDEDDEDPLYDIADARRTGNPEEAAAIKEAIEVVRDVEAMLAAEKAELLQLHYHKGLSALEIAGVLGLKVGNVHVMLTRVRDEFRAAYVARALYQRGTCADLRVIAGALDSPASTHAQKQIHKHARKCAVCQDEEERFTKPESALGAMAILPFPFFLRELAQDAAWRAGIEGGIVAGTSGGAGGAAAGSAGSTGGAAGTAGGAAGSGATQGLLAGFGHFVASLATIGLVPLLVGVAVVTVAVPAAVYVAPGGDDMTSRVRGVFDVWGGGSAQPGPACVPASVAALGPTTADTAYASAVFARSNDVRARAGMPPLATDDRLAAAAAEYARFVAETRWWDTTAGSGAGIHVGADCRDHFDRAVAHGYPHTVVGENVLWQTGNVTPEAAFAALLAGPHEDPAVPDFARTGVACYVRLDVQERACVQIFAGEP
jgi:RNA polymerase sigma factor (sigma-70 family)